MPAALVLALLLLVAVACAEDGDADDDSAAWCEAVARLDAAMGAADLGEGLSVPDVDPFGSYRSEAQDVVDLAPEPWDIDIEENLSAVLRQPLDDGGAGDPLGGQEASEERTAEAASIAIFVETTCAEPTRWWVAQWCDDVRSLERWHTAYEGYAPSMTLERLGTLTMVREQLVVVADGAPDAVAERLQETVAEDEVRHPADDRHATDAEVVTFIEERCGVTITYLQPDAQDVPGRP